MPFHYTHYYAKLWNLSDNKLETKNNQMKSLKLLAKAWKLFLQQTKKQNQSNEKFEIVAKNLKIVSTTN